jgi:response regulator RpfG family c-di-GMP phosphodiesterase
MTRKVLLVDDEENVLHALARNFRRDFEMETALGPQAALSMISERGPYAVVVSDFRMPDMDGLELLSQVRKQWPDTVRMILSGNADFQSVMASVNDGCVFQFMTKPCPVDNLRNSITGALRHHELAVRERQDILENTLNGSAAMMAEVLSMVSSLAFSRASRLRRYVQHMARCLGAENLWVYDLAAILSQIGCIAVPAGIQEKVCSGTPLSLQEETTFLAHPLTGHRLLAGIPRLEVVAEIVLHQLKSFEELRKANLSETVRFGAQMLLIASRVDDTVARGAPLDAAIQYMAARPSVYQPSLVGSVQSVEAWLQEMQIREVPIEDLRLGMIIREDLYGQAGLLIVARGQSVSEALIARLRIFFRTAGLNPRISVLAPAPHPVSRPELARHGSRVAEP